MPSSAQDARRTPSSSSGATTAGTSGKKRLPGKTPLWQRSTHVPLVFAGPGVTPAQKCSRPAELLDIYPTLIDLCALPPAPHTLEGVSLKPQLVDATAPRDRPAITSHNQGNSSIVTEQWRYIRYVDQSEELYDTAADPNEWTNLAARTSRSMQRTKRLDPKSRQRPRPRQCRPHPDAL